MKLQEILQDRHLWEVVEHGIKDGDEASQIQNNLAVMQIRWALQESLLLDIEAMTSASKVWSMLSSRFEMKRPIDIPMDAVKKQKVF